MALDRRALIVGGLFVAGAAGGGYYWWKEDQKLRQTYGVVELGSGGAKWSVLTFKRERVTQVAAAGGETATSGVAFVRYRRTERAAGDAPVDVRDPAKISETVAAIENSIDEVRRRGADGHFVVIGSSSLSSMDHWAELKQALDTKCWELIGQQFETVDAETELRYLYRWVIPRIDRYTSSLIDIGSGNIKCGYLVQGTSDRFESFSIDQGATKLAREAASRAEATGAPFNEALRSACAELVTAELEQRGQRGLARQKIYLSGGSSWAMTSVTHPQEVREAEFWVPVTAADIARYREIAFADPTLETALNALPDGSPDRDAISEVKRAFSQPERILAGAEILSSLSQTLHFDQNQREIFFTKEGQFAWSTMHLLVKLRLEQVDF